jgi:eukaryotic-like serine/threonine-protein kinase
MRAALMVTHGPHPFRAMPDRLRIPPDLPLERVLTPERSFVVRLGPSGALGVARRCAGRPEQLRRRLDALATAAPAGVIVESRLVEHDGSCWAVRRWIHGRSLREIRREGALPAQDALRIARSLAQSAAALGARGLVHGRLHASNVILGTDAELRIVDALDVGALPVPIPTREAPAEVSLAPEILRGESASPATDVYGMALLLCELLLGAHPFAAESIYESARRALYEQPESWEAEGAAVPRELVPILRAALAKRAGRRLKSVGAFVAELDRAAACPPPVSTASEPFRAAPPRRPISDQPRGRALAEVLVPDAVAARVRRWRIVGVDALQRMRTRLASLGGLRPSRKVRRLVPPALAALAILVVGAVAAGWSRTSALEKEVEELLLARDTARAAARVLEWQRESGEDATTRKLLGDVSCARGEYARCLDLYRRALERETRFASNPRLRDNTLALLDRGDLQHRLREIVVQLEDVDAALLAGTRHENYWRRWNSVRGLEARQAGGKVDLGVVYGLDVVHAGSCSTRQASLAKIVQLRVASALPYLEQARRNGSRALFGDLCLGSDLGRAIRALRNDGQMSAGGR